VRVVSLNCKCSNSEDKVKVHTIMPPVPVVPPVAPIAGGSNDGSASAVCQDLGAGTTTVNQGDKAEALAADVGVSGECRMVPMSPEVYGELRGAKPGEPMTYNCKLRYQRVVGSLLHLA
jgi:hypothetical protein